MTLAHPSSYPRPGYHPSSDSFPPVDARYYQLPAPSSQAIYQRNVPYVAESTRLENQQHVEYSLDATSTNGQGFYHVHGHHGNAVLPSGAPAQWPYQGNQEYPTYQSAQPGQGWLSDQPQPFDQPYTTPPSLQPQSESSLQSGLLNQHQAFYSEPDNISPVSDSPDSLEYPPYYSDQPLEYEAGHYSPGSSGSDSSRDTSIYQDPRSAHFPHTSHDTCTEPRRSRHDPPVFYEYTNVVRNSTQPDHRPSQVIPTLSTVRHGQQSHSFTTPQPHSYITQRSSSPMAHLPYPEDIQRQLVSPYGHPSDNDPRWTEYRPEARTYVHHPQPHYPIPPTPAETQYHQRYTPGSIALPAPTRSPPLIEDTPKKPLSLACLFCRKRKIACGSPPPDREDRTCNQCARRNLTCVYPNASRRGMRPRNDGESGDNIFQMPIIVNQ